MRGCAPRLQQLLFVGHFYLGLLQLSLHLGIDGSQRTLGADSGHLDLHRRRRFAHFCLLLFRRHLDLARIDATGTQELGKPLPGVGAELWVLDHLADLRTIPNFYLRNLCLNIAQDTVHMQFNCDGTHIVSTDEYQRFLQDNVEMAG